MKRISLLCSLFLAFTASALAEVKPNSLFSDGVVLQQGIEVPVWGTASDGEKVTVQIQGQTATTTAVNGKWILRLKPLKAGGPFRMTIAGGNTIALADVLVGEVWLCSGQSNMAFQLSRAANAQEAIASAVDPQLRLFTVPSQALDTAGPECAGNWKESTPESAASFSAVAWFFGRELRKNLKVPVGLINSSVGGTPAEAWTARSALEADPDLKPILQKYAEALKSYNPEKAAAPPRKKTPKAAASEARAGKAAPKAPRAVANPTRSPKRPSALYNGMIAPLQPFAIAGAIWYQGEANSGRAAEYQKLFPAMIRSWRQGWGQGEFPFLFVQIAPHQRMTPEIREAQLLTSQTVPKTAMAVITDIGEETDIHPKKKQPVGERLAAAARAIAYGQKIEYSGPVYEKMSVEGKNVRSELQPPRWRPRGPGR